MSRQSDCWGWGVQQWGGPLTTRTLPLELAFQSPHQQNSRTSFDEQSAFVDPVELVPLSIVVVVAEVEEALQQ